MLVRNVLLTGVVTLMVVVSANADLILPNTHTVARCATIGNLADFPDIAIVGTYGSMSTPITVRYLVMPDSCLRGGYKFAPVYLFWVEKSYLQAQGLENLPLAGIIPSTTAKKRSETGAAAQMGLLSIQGDLFSGAVPDSNLIVKESLVYKLSMKSDGGFNTYLAEKVAVDKNGSEQRSSYASSIRIKSAAAPTVGSLKVNPRFSSGRLVLSPEFSGNLSGELLDCRGRVASRFVRTVHQGATYVVPISKMTVGIYWLRISDGKSTGCVRLNTFE